MIDRDRLADSDHPLGRQRQESERAEERREQIGSGNRSEKIWTYNFPENRVTDHRAGVTLHKLESVLEGELDELLSAIRRELSESVESADRGAAPSS